VVTRGEVGTWKTRLLIIRCTDLDRGSRPSLRLSWEAVYALDEVSFADSSVGFKRAKCENDEQRKRTKEENEQKKR
jgi:hypothetical protein